jgi:hypothetical protein
VLHPFWHSPGEPIFASEAPQNWVRIPHPKIDKLACQAKGEGIFAEGEIPRIAFLINLLFFLT